MYKIVICDDEISYIQELKDLIEECNQNKRKLEFLTFQSGEELIEKLPMDSDALFLDIQLQDMNGNDVAEQINEMEYQGLLVLCSGIFLPTPQTIKISPYRYLLKQEARENTRRDIFEIFEEMDRQKVYFTLEAYYNREKIIVRTMDIKYFTHHKKGSVIHLNQKNQIKYTEGNLLVHYNFQKLLEMLSPIGFSIVHNSYLINMKYVEKVDVQKELVYLEGKTIPLARGKAAQFFDEFMKYMGSKYRERLR